jgi:hypothetical protein
MIYCLVDEQGDLRLGIPKGANAAAYVVDLPRGEGQQDNSDVAWRLLVDVRAPIRLIQFGIDPT